MSADPILTPSTPEEWTLECCCCGDDAAIGEVYDGQPLLCGCKGHVSVDTESEPYVLISEEGCDCEWSR